MEDTTNIPGEEQTGRLQQPAVGGSLPPAQQFREWETDSLKAMEVFKANGMEWSGLCSKAMANAYRRCAEFLERQ